MSETSLWLGNGIERSQLDEATAAYEPKRGRPPDVSVLIISYNTAAMTLACVDSVRAHTKKATYEIIVVDNASRDCSADLIARAHPDVHLVRSPENLGFARANNLAAEIATGKYLLLLNPDTLVLEGAIDTLADFARARPEARIWGGRTVFADGALNPSSCWRRMTLWNLFCRASGLTGLFPASEVFNGEAYGGWQRESEREVDIVSGCLLLIEHRFWQKLGGFDTRFFMYGEDADLCIRARDLGARPLVTPDAQIIHYGGASEGVQAEQKIHVCRAKVSLLARHMAHGFRSVAIFLFWLWPLSRVLACRAAMVLRPGGAITSQYAVWLEVWRRRREWQNGFEQTHT